MGARPPDALGSLYARYFLGELSFLFYFFWSLPRGSVIFLLAGLVFFSFRLPLATGGGLLCACWKVLRIAEARGVSTVSRVVWPVNFAFHELCRWQWWRGVGAAVVIVA